MTTGPGYRYGMPGGGRWMSGAEHAKMRACDADREGTADMLRGAFVEGRLSQEELDERLGQVYAARTYGDLAAQTADLPVQRPLPMMPPPRPMARQQTNSMAIGSFVCGLLEIFSLGLTAIPAVVLGHSARRQIRRTGQPGDGFAVAGLVLGWLGIAFMTIFLVVGIAAVASTAHPGGLPASHSIPHHRFFKPGAPPPPAQPGL
ncbi:MAG TPA: DUF1707 and DUF4190 domain-containing protein [Streptosporangiaceae bacterium]|jgi:hypothetical protein|nr:DUF1707 and DUF4190 domain-containing protein [Streptosporangiaceae bacterium]